MARDLGPPTTFAQGDLLNQNGRKANRHLLSPNCDATHFLLVLSRQFSSTTPFPFIGSPTVHSQNPSTHSLRTSKILPSLRCPHEALVGVEQTTLHLRMSELYLVAFCAPAKSLTFSGLMENPLVGKKLKS